MTIKIYKPSKTSMQSGFKKTKLWLAEYISEVEKVKDSLMGWNSSLDTKSQIKLFFDTKEQAIEWAKKARGVEIAKVLRQVKSLPDKQAPVFVVGDFNEPSHLDWTEAAAKAGRHPIKVAYPTSTEMVKAGFSDSYRKIYPDEMKNPGITWSPAYKVSDPLTHHDRIDFVYFKGKGLQVKDVKILGENKENADLVVSPYPSDHRAVVATFSLPKKTK